jgi:hypothetical protein
VSMTGCRDPRGSKGRIGGKKPLEEDRILT